MEKKRIFSGMRPTGDLHIGHLSVLENWIKLQEEYECVFGVVDLHALTTSYEDPSEIRKNGRNMLLDWLSVGLDPEKSTIMRQSNVKQHSELHLLLSMLTPLSWLERVPTYKDQLQQLSKAGKNITTYGFLGYPLLMAADILVYKSEVVPVGEDQLPHLELTRELGRRFNHLYGKEIFPEPKALLAEISMVPGIDKRKMSKSYNNYIPIYSNHKDLQEKVRQMITDPARIKKDDPGNPDICVVYSYHKIYNKNEEEEIADLCRKGQIGCVQCKKKLADKLISFLEPIWIKREELSKDEKILDDILEAGNIKATEMAEKTLAEVRDIMGVY